MLVTHGGRESENSLRIARIDPKFPFYKLPSYDNCIEQICRLLLNRYGAVPFTEQDDWTTESEENFYTENFYARPRFGNTLDLPINRDLHPTTSSLEHGGVWHPLFGRFYREPAGAYLEGSTVTCKTPHEFALRIRRGQQMAGFLARQISTDGYAVNIFSKVSDGKGESAGMHSGYLISRDLRHRFFTHGFMDPREKLLMKILSTEAQDLITLEVLLQVFIGEGKIGSECGNPQDPFQIYGRSDFISTLMGIDTPHSRPIINTRDEPHADYKRFARLHVINREGRGYWSLMFDFGLHALFLSALEDGMVLPWRLLEPLDVIQKISRDLTLSTTIRVVVRSRDHNSIEIKTPIELWEDIFSCLEHYVSWAHVPSWMIEILEKAKYVLGHLKNGDPEGEADRYLDWRIHRAFLAFYMERKFGLDYLHPDSWNHESVLAAEQKLHQHDDPRLWIAANEYCRTVDFEKFLYPYGKPEEERFWKEGEPEDGRSYLQWLACTHPDLKDNSEMLDWGLLEITGHEPRRVFLSDPRLFGKEHIRKIFGETIALSTPEARDNFVVRLLEEMGEHKKIRELHALEPIPIRGKEPPLAPSQPKPTALPPWDD